MTASDWRSVLTGADVVVNATGALQDGSRDSLSAIHDRAIGTLLDALSGSSIRLVHISAAGVASDASTEFLRSKARGDARIAASGCDWVILRPTLVVGAQAYGGTALLRAAAALPLAEVSVFAEASVQTVWVEDLAEAVVEAARGNIPRGTIADITEGDSRSFAETVRLFRQWLGLSPWQRAVVLPVELVWAVGRVADVLGSLGWRSPLRTTALRSVAAGITGSPTAWQAVGRTRFRNLEETLELLPATVQERWFARLFLLMPVAVATLSAFWIISGFVGLIRFEESGAVLTSRGWPERVSALAVSSGILADIGLGAAILYRPWARCASIAMIILALVYLGGATLFAADLWSDPLGPLVKVLPSITLALLTAAMLETDR